MLNIEGIAFITGAGGGIGRVTAMTFARAGAAGIHITDLNVKALEETASLLQAEASNPSFRIHSSQLDVSNEDQVIATLKETIAIFGRLDYAVNIAGVVEQELGATADVSMETFDRINGVNQRGAFMCMHEELSAMRAQNPVVRLVGRPAVRGAITNISSTAGIRSHHGISSYVTSKHAVIGMTKSAATSHASDGIRVNAVCPGFVDTMMGRGFTALDLDTYSVQTVPQKRMADPQEIADVVLFLTSENASYVTGATWVVDGGLTIAV